MRSGDNVTPLLPENLFKHVSISMPKGLTCWQIGCRERADKEAFYEGQGKTGVAFMRMALTTLALLNKLSGNPVIKQSFLQPPLVGSAAFNCLHFLELLVGILTDWCESSCVVLTLWLALLACALCCLS